MHQLPRIPFVLVVSLAAAFASLAPMGCTPAEEDAPAGEAVGSGAAAVTVEPAAAPLAGCSGYARLGHVLDTNAPLFPGDPPFSSTIFNTIENDGYKLELISMGTHTGTHVSAPCHFITGAKCIDDLPASAFVLPAYVLDVRARIKKDPGHADFKLSVQDIKDFEAKIGKPIPSHAIVILFTGFEDNWGKSSYFDPAPGFSAAAVTWMVQKRGIASLGSDTFGPDASSDQSFEGSSTIFAAGGTTFENLAGLDQLHTYGDTVIATPNRLKNGSGFPTSPIALLR